MTSLFVGTRKGLFRLEQKGKNWQLSDPLFRAVPVSMVLQDPRDGAIYACLDHGHFGVKLQRSDDGKTFSEIGAPTYPQLPDGQEEKDLFGRPWPRKLKLVWALEIDPRQPGALWCGTIPGGLFHSVDRGQTWQLVESLWNEPRRKEWLGGGADLPGIHSICVDPRNPDHVMVGVSTGGIWRTTDGGATWAPCSFGMRQEHVPEDQRHDPVRQDVHRVVQSPTAPDRVWVQHHNGIFRSQKGVDSYREITAKAVSRFGFATVVHPTDPDTAWFVPAQKDEIRIPNDGRFCVLRTEDGGKTFTELRRGLPQRHCYDLVYRHALDLLPAEQKGAAPTLAMGSTTGGLWVSGDGGQRWNLVDARLPPVYVVRFGSQPAPRPKARGTSPAKARPNPRPAPRRGTRSAAPATPPKKETARQGGRPRAR